MPIVDGETSTKFIREFELTSSPPLSPLATSHGRIPVFAVSASLVEGKYSEYVEGGFDGWIMKPINFRKLDVLMMGIWDEIQRKACAHVPGMWESGGWFEVKCELAIRNKAIDIQYD